MALQPDGKLVIVGFSQNAGDDDLIVMSLNHKGKLSACQRFNGLKVSHDYTIYNLTVFLL
jgi:hypothetical protein